MVENVWFFFFRNLEYYRKISKDIAQPSLHKNPFGGVGKLRFILSGGRQDMRGHSGKQRVKKELKRI